MLLFVAGTIRHRDRKQILIIIWTHRGGKEKKNHSWVTAKWFRIAKLQNTVALCVHFPFPGMWLVLWLEVGLGRWMTSPVVFTFEFWHSGTLCFYSPHHHHPDHHHPLSLKPGLCSALPFLSPSKNTSFSLPPLKQLPAYEVEKMTLHLMMNGTWPLEPVPVGLTQHGIYIKPGDLTLSTVYIREKQGRGCPLPRRCRKWRLNIC